MPIREELAFLRESAERLHEIAASDASISDQLLRMAADLEAGADELEVIRVSKQKNHAESLPTRTDESRVPGH